MERGNCGKIDFMKQIFVVGIGPGGVDCMTSCAARAIESADLVVGYEKYVELVKAREAASKAQINAEKIKANKEVKAAKEALKQEM